MILMKNGDTFGSGLNTKGQLGEGNEANLKFYKIDSMKNVSKISCGAHHSLILMNDEIDLKFIQLQDSILFCW